MERPDIGAVTEYLLRLQDRICEAFEALDGRGCFTRERLEGPGGTVAQPRALEEGDVFEKAAVHFTRARGDRLPPAATERRPELAGASFEAASLSLIAHPRNPYVPTSHMNVRCFVATPPAGGDDMVSEVWWIGGGFDLTPTYGFEEDAVHWHETARAACAPLGPEAYPRFKKWCDDYFFLEHRGEPRGIGGIFFDDLREGDFHTCFAFLRSVGDHFLEGYQPIVERRRDTPWSEREREFQLLRRGRYVEFNLVYDRGTLYGLQSGRRIESVLASMPPRVRWPYDWHPAPGSPEAELTEKYLVARDWV